MAASAQIVVDRVNHLYRPPRGREVLALDQVSLEVANREFVALHELDDAAALEINRWNQHEITYEPRRHGNTESIL